MDGQQLVAEAEALCSSLEDLHRRMTEPDDDWEAINDYRLDQVEQMCAQAHRRLERRKAAHARASANLFIWTTPYRFGAR